MKSCCRKTRGAPASGFSASWSRF